MFCALKAFSWPCDLKTKKATAAAAMSAMTTTAAISLPLCFLASPRTMAALPEPLEEIFAENPEPDRRRWWRDGGGIRAGRAGSGSGAPRFVELKFSAVLTCVLLEPESRCRRFRSVRRSAAVW